MTKKQISTINNIMLLLYYFIEIACGCLNVSEREEFNLNQKFYINFILHRPSNEIVSFSQVNSDTTTIQTLNKLFPHILLLYINLTSSRYIHFSFGNQLGSSCCRQCSVKQMIFLLPIYVVVVMEILS